MKGAVPRDHAAMTRPRPNPEVITGLGDRLRALRIARGLTQEALGAAAGVKAETLSRLETGQRSPDLLTLANLAAALACTVRDLFPPDAKDAVEPDPRAQLLLNGWSTLDEADQTRILDLLSRLRPKG